MPLPALHLYNLMTPVLNQNCKLMAQSPLPYSKPLGALPGPGRGSSSLPLQEGFPGIPASQQHLSLPEGGEDLTSDHKNAPQPYPNPWSSSQVRHGSGSSIPSQPSSCHRLCSQPRVRRDSRVCKATCRRPPTSPLPVSPTDRRSHKKSRWFNRSPHPKPASGAPGARAVGPDPSAVPGTGTPCLCASRTAGSALPTAAWLPVPDHRP